MLFEPHPGQQAILAGLKRFNHIRCGRRFGKTRLGQHYLFSGKRGMAAGFPVAWFAPNYKYLSDPWREMKDSLAPLIKRKDEVERRIELCTGGSVEMWTCDDDNPARGRKFAKIVIDEAAMIRDLRGKWQRAIRPTLTDLRGGAMFLSTPKGRNDFHELEQTAITRPNTWARFHSPTSANPYIDPAEIEEAKADLPMLAYRQEYLAEYVDFGGAIVKPEWLRYGAPDYEWPIVLGVDLAISTKTTADYTAIAALSRDRQGRIYVLAVLRFRLPFNEILQQIQMAAQTYKPVSILIENNQFQAAVVQELLRTTTLPVRGVRRDVDKMTSFMPMASRYEQGLVYHAQTLPAYYVDELLAFTGGPDDAHDDCVDAVSTAYLGLGHTGQSVIVANERDSIRLVQ